MRKILITALLTLVPIMGIAADGHKGLTKTDYAGPKPRPAYVVVKQSWSDYFRSWTFRGSNNRTTNTSSWYYDSDGDLRSK